MFNLGDKNGQVTIFVIVGILIIAGIGLAVYALSDKSDDVVNDGAENPEFEPVYNYVQDCFEQTAEEAVIYVSEQGGYYDLVGLVESVYIYPYATSVYIDKYKNYVPLNGFVEDQFGLYVENNLGNCLGEFEGLEDYEIDLGRVDVNSEINANNIKFNGKIFVDVSKSDVNERFEDFDYVVKNVRVGELLELSREIVEDQVKDPRQICLSCLNDLAEEYGVEINLIESESGEDYIYEIIDDQSLIRDENLVWTFGGRYDFPDCSTTEECYDEFA